ncbi:hypothetical protein T4A_5247 [Trichinella pseudospiralis]|uniref:Uncharacterized protein n=1 Tax=Trichinella pseudospiralis TaxID=6337 RepID=A0A0V1K4L9_TRIPS|nr:hypothetical protein T4A_5247 [Trichinella pseudospiralis]KRZ41749.1 hypothetical protein T4C_9124 [Trichinella pseudospiralis]
MEVKNMNNFNGCAFFIHIQDCFGIVLFNIDVMVWKVFEYTVESGCSELHGPNKLVRYKDSSLYPNF